MLRDHTFSRGPVHPTIDWNFFKTFLFINLGINELAEKCTASSSPEASWCGDARRAPGEETQRCLWTQTGTSASNPWRRLGSRLRRGVFDWRACHRTPPSSAGKNRDQLWNEYEIHFHAQQECTSTLCNFYFSYVTWVTFYRKRFKIQLGMTTYVPYPITSSLRFISHYNDHRTKLQ